MVTMTVLLIFNVVCACGELVACGAVAGGFVAGADWPIVAVGGSIVGAAWLVVGSDDNGTTNGSALGAQPPKINTAKNTAKNTSERRLGISYRSPMAV
jgi:hypothetical protein